MVEDAVRTAADDERIALDASVEALAGLGPKRAELFRSLGIETIRDLLLHLPRAYQDRRNITPIAQAEEGAAVTIQGEVVSARNVRLRGRMSMAVITLRDESGEIGATFFGRGFLARTAFARGNHVFLTGTVARYKGLSLKNPEYEVLSGDDEDRLHTGRVAPVYRLTEGLSQRLLRRCIHHALNSADLEGIADPLGASLRDRYGFPPFAQALRDVHYPDSIEEGRTAQERFIYEELFGLQLRILSDRARRLDEEQGIRHTVDGPRLDAFRGSLPFQLTPAQDRVVEDILADMASPRPMLRLLQGDVGCGKTIVILHALAAAADGGHQAALMVPTEILAEQHATHLKRLLEPLGVEVALLTGALRCAAGLRGRIAQGAVPLVVGTHALIQDKTIFHNLGLAVIDEQHRFGVVQRDALAAKGANVDILQTTATPIPRTLAITVYGGMDVSVIDELPPGRLPVATRRLSESKAPELYRSIHKHAAKGSQTYIICPLVEESEKRGDLTSVISHYESLSAGPLEGLRTSLLHGRLDITEKDAIMTQFKAGEIDVLFSTTVIEVGIDVSTANTMIIENAAQFGLTQLHQLRGRVGRGEEKARCILLGRPKTDDGRRRLEVLCRCNSGFDIAEEDLALRGPGEFYGVRQAGLSDLRVADLIRDARWLDRARRDAQAWLAAGNTVPEAGQDAIRV